MRSYRYCKPAKKTSNKVVLKSYTQKIGLATSFVFSKPVFLTASAMMFVASNYFLVTAFSQVSKASSAEPFINLKKMFRQAYVLSTFNPE